MYTLPPYHPGYTTPAHTVSYMSDNVTHVQHDSRSRRSTLGRVTLLLGRKRSLWAELYRFLEEEGVSGQSYPASSRVGGFSGQSYPASSRVGGVLWAEFLVILLLVTDSGKPENAQVPLKSLNILVRKRQ